MESEKGEGGLLYTLRYDAARFFQAAIGRVDPFDAVKRFVHLEGNRLRLGKEGSEIQEINLADFRHIYMVGGGKATAPMARAIEHLLGERLSQGIITVKYGFSDPLSRTQNIEAGHPLPDAQGIEGTGKILALLKAAQERDLVISLLSGGGSALLPQPAPSITLEEKQKVTRILIESGASIDEINTVRKHISLSKGGQMAKAAFPATVINLMLSDVVGDHPDVIASGPFSPDRSTFQEAWEVIQRYRFSLIPDSVKRYLQQGLIGEIPETPKDGDPIFRVVYHRVIGSNLLALEAVKEEALNVGYHPLILSSMIEGETREVARVHAAVVKEVLHSGQPVHPPACIISGGETTVTVKGKGLGGRNLEFSLAMALELHGLAPRVVVLSGGTDGNDGNTEAAGAMVDPSTVERGKGKGLNALAYLAENDSYHYFEKQGDLLITGPTRTNVMDVRIMLVQ